MLKTALSMIMVINALTGVSAEMSTAQNYVVDSVEDNVVAIELDYGIMKYIHGEDFNVLPEEGKPLAVSCTVGTLTNEVEMLDGEIAYQFKSYDDEDWWLVRNADVSRPDVKLEVGGEYTIISYDNGTTKDHYECTGEPCVNKEECECWLYDDMLIDIYKN